MELDRRAVFHVLIFGSNVDGDEPRESGTVTYNQYDNNGNLMRLTDARGTVAAMTDDALNRVTARSYTPGGSTVATANINYNYDQDFRGALSSVCAPDCTLASTSKSTS